MAKSSRRTTPPPLAPHGHRGVRDSRSRVTGSCKRTNSPWRTEQREPLRARAHRALNSSGGDGLPRPPLVARLGPTSHPPPLALRRGQRAGGDAVGPEDELAGRRNAAAGSRWARVRRTAPICRAPLRSEQARRPAPGERKSREAQTAAPRCAESVRGLRSVRSRFPSPRLASESLDPEPCT